MEVLNKLLEKAKELQLLKGIIVGQQENQIEITHLFFVDDTLIFCQPDISSLIFLRCVLLYF